MARATLRAERKAKAWALRKTGLSLRAIATELDCSAQHIHDLIREEIEDLRPAREDVEATRQLLRDQLEGALKVAHEVMDRVHYAHSNGRLIIDPDTGEKMIDSGPNLAAAGMIEKLNASLRKLDGLDAASKTQTDGTLRHIVDGVDMAALR